MKLKPWKQLTPNRLLSIQGSLNADIEYLGDVLSKDEHYLYVFYQSNPNRKAGHTEFLALTTISGKTYILSVHPEQLENWQWITGIQCKSCKDLIFSMFKHDFKQCYCTKAFVDGGRGYMRSNDFGSMILFNTLTGELKV